MFKCKDLSCGYLDKPSVFALWRLSQVSIYNEFCSIEQCSQSQIYLLIPLNAIANLRPGFLFSAELCRLTEIAMTEIVIINSNGQDKMTK